MRTTRPDGHCSTATRSRLTWEKWRDHSLFKLNVPPGCRGQHRTATAARFTAIVCCAISSAGAAFAVSETRCRSARRGGPNGIGVHEESDGRWPFVHRASIGSPFTRAGYRKMIARLCEAARFSFPVHPHMFRHACGYKLANDGRDTRAPSALPWPQEHSARRSLYQAVAGSVPRFLARLSGQRDSYSDYLRGAAPSGKRMYDAATDPAGPIEIDANLYGFGLV